MIEKKYSLKLLTVFDPDLVGQRASSSSKNITHGAEFLALWKHWRTDFSLSPKYYKRGKKDTFKSILIYLQLTVTI